MSKMENSLLFFAIETSNYEDECDILQIFMKSGSTTFNEYVEPTQQISKEITKIHGLSVKNSELYRDKVLKRSRPLVVVLKRLFQWLQGMNKTFTLIGHQYFHYNRLMIAIRDVALAREFESVIVCFTCTFNRFREKFPDCDRKQLTVHRLAAKGGLRWSRQNGRNIKTSTILLEKLVKLHFTDEELTAQEKSSKIRKWFLQNSLS